MHQRRSARRARGSRRPSRSGGPPSARVCLAIGGGEASRRNVRVDLGGGQVLVAEELLEEPQTRASVEEVRRKGVPQRVGRDAFWETRGAAQPIQPVAQTADPERAAGMVEEDGRRRW